jgi:hypothetical protein
MTDPRRRFDPTETASNAKAHSARSGFFGIPHQEHRRGDAEIFLFC